MLQSEKGTTTSITLDPKVLHPLQKLTLLVSNPVGLDALAPSDTRHSEEVDFIEVSTKIGAKASKVERWFGLDYIF